MTYNPLDKRNLAKSIAHEFLSRPMQPWPAGRFEGAGVYALYYTGIHQPYDLYAALQVMDTLDPAAIPIYVGRAVSQGARKGKRAFDDPPGPAVYNRLRVHEQSIDQAANLAVTDFLCRYLIVDEIWVPLAESLLIAHFAPVWNQAVEGFGIKTPGRGRLGQRRSEWDVLHPGRAFATHLAASSKSVDLVRTQVLDHLKHYFASRRGRSSL